MQTRTGHSVNIIFHDAPIHQVRYIKILAWLRE